jgi:pimeloyl-ACP methyl ester carboxylesterase
LKNAEILAKRIRRAELEVVEDAGHAVFLDDRDLVRRMVVKLEKSIEKGLGAVVG